MIHTLRIPCSCEMIFDFFKLKVQLLMINKRKHGEQIIEVDNRKCENRQNIVFMETSICEELLQLLQECHNHYQKDKKEFICVL